MVLSYRRLSNSDHRRISEFAEELEALGEINDGFLWPQELLIAEFYGSSGWGAFNEQGDLLAFLLYREVPGAKEISTLSTLPKYRGRGIMEHLLLELYNELRHDESIWLEVHQENLRAQKLYKKSGFVQTGVRPGYYRDGGAALLFLKQKSLDPV